jgi:hypothetical protein
VAWTFPGIGGGEGMPSFVGPRDLLTLQTLSWHPIVTLRDLKEVPSFSIPTFSFPSYKIFIFKLLP